MGCGTKINPSNIFSENIIANNNEIYADYHNFFCNYEAIFHIVSVIFNILVPTLIMTLYASIVKFPASTSEHSTSDTRKS
jgi:hypothetical protein